MWNGFFIFMCLKSIKDICYIVFNTFVIIFFWVGAMQEIFVLNTLNHPMYLTNFKISCAGIVNADENENN